MHFNRWIYMKNELDPEVVNYSQHNCIVRLDQKLIRSTWRLDETNRFCQISYVCMESEYVSRSSSISFIGLMKIVNQIILRG